MNTTKNPFIHILILIHVTAPIVNCCFGFKTASPFIDTGRYDTKAINRKNGNPDDVVIMVEHKRRVSFKARVLHSKSSMMSSEWNFDRVIPRGGAMEGGEGEGEEKMGGSKYNQKGESCVFPQYSLPTTSTANDGPMEEDGHPTHNSSPCTQGLILMDSFCPYHGQYLSDKAKRAYNAGIVHTVSDYVLSCLIRDSELAPEADEGGNGDHSEVDRYLSARVPKSKDDLVVWYNAIPFDIKGIICESDSGLDDAEKLGVAIGLFPSRHDGYNSKSTLTYMTKQMTTLIINSLTFLFTPFQKGQDVINF